MNKVSENHQDNCGNDFANQIIDFSYRIKGSFPVSFLFFPENFYHRSFHVSGFRGEVPLLMNQVLLHIHLVGDRNT